ncbi:hypothetical protein HDU97_005318 [Phlyctochytrium planicorne]|nr:hypothetical protein HDU97_005318 [Phlyctochytrium planicorne]
MYNVLICDRKDPLESLNLRSCENLEALSLAQVAKTTIVQALTGLMVLFFTALAQVAGNLYVQAFIDLFFLCYQYLFFVATNKIRDESISRNFRMYALFSGQFMTKANVGLSQKRNNNKR